MKKLFCLSDQSLGAESLNPNYRYSNLDKRKFIAYISYRHIDIYLYNNLMSKELKQIIKVAKALADENRFKIFTTISEKGEISCKEITSLFNLTQPTISHHLRVLMESGLIDFRKEGQWSYFYVNKEILDKYVSSLAVHATQ